MSIELVFGGLIFLYLLLMWKAGKSYPILYLFLFTYYLQYIFSTYLIYNNYSSMESQMVITPAAYFGYAIPALFFLFLGVLLFSRKDYNFRELLGKIDANEAKQFGYLLLIISYTMDLIGRSGISIFDSIISFTGYLKYLGAFCLLFTRSKINYIIIGIVFIQLAIVVLATGVFISFFIWATYLFFFICLRFKIPFFLRIAFIIISLPVLFAIQSIKHEYRDQTWSGKKQGGVGLYADLLEKSNKEDQNTPFAESKGVISTIGRLTQGWHLGLTLKHVPRREPIADGMEMWSDIVASILPRIVFAEKKSVNSQAKFEQYTGHKLRGNTSMTIGVLGDFYINFGRGGSFVMLFLFGALVAWFYKFFMRKYVAPDPINIVFVPFILSYLVRANNDFYMFFNGMVKGFIMFLIINYIRHRFFVPKKTTTQQTFTPVYPVVK
jgi:hypothetical protein